MGQFAFQGVRFDEGFLTAVRCDGAGLRFTRQERALLSLLAQHPGRLFIREELFAAMGSRGSDRNLDYVVNRLRAKLGDTAPEKRFISTQYGEGYVWVATAAEPAKAEAYLTIGPVRPADDACLSQVLAPLQDALRQRLGKPGDVAIAPELDATAAGQARFSLAVSVHRTAGRVHMAFALRHGPSGEVAAAFHETFEIAPSAEALEALADAVTEAAWKRMALGPAAAPAPTDHPLHVRMHDASVLLDPPGATWVANGEQLARQRARNKTDPVLAVMWAMHLFGRMLLAPGSPEAMTEQEGEIEALVLEHLAAVRSDPMLALAAAKLLLGVNRGHEDLAEELANAAFAGSAAFAAAFPMLGQIKAQRGDLDEARRLYDEGLSLCEPGSAYELYVQILKATTLMAQDDRAGVEDCYRRIVEITPHAPEQFGVMMLPPTDEGLARRLARVIDQMDEERARRSIAYLHRRVASHFQRPTHVANIMAGPLVHLTRRFGPGVVSDEIWTALPEELQHLRRERLAAG